MLKLHKHSAGRYYTGRFFIDHIPGNGWHWYRADDPSIGGEWRKTKTEAVADLLAYQHKVSAETTSTPPAPPVVETPKPEVPKCHACNGSGKYYFGGATVNGVYTGKVGKCFRCDGKGYQTPDDEKRNWGYDTFHRKVNA